jgi:peroxygenase
MKVVSNNPNSPIRTSNQEAPKTEDSPLKKHVDFFDRNHDGITTLSESYQGLRALGAGRVLSGAGALFINLGLGSKTGEPFYKLQINNSNIHLAKHDSDSDIYDQQGQFVPEKFEEMFAKHDTNHDGAFNKPEIDAMIKINKETTAGQIASKAEFGLLLSLGGQVSDSGEKVLTRQRMQELYDGTLFYTIEKEKSGS